MEVGQVYLVNSAGEGLIGLKWRNFINFSLALQLQEKYTQTFLNGCKTSICQCCTVQDREMFKSQPEEFSPLKVKDYSV